ncbi:MAG: succinate dehydrogenase, hydrophobic membrane anchor protein [Gammaproteobacteria bacterium]
MALKGSDGLQDWLLQRITGVYLFFYVIFIAYYYNLTCQLGFSFLAWRTVFTPLWVRYASLFAIVCILIHAWLGLWTVLTDYVKFTLLRLFLQFVILALLFSFTLWAINILFFDSWNFWKALG